MHSKDYDGWNDQKKRIDGGRANRFYNSRDVWWCSLGLNVGFEHDGLGDEYQRPVLVIKGLGPRTCLIAPLTSSDHKHPMRIPAGIIAGEEASAIISQIRVVDTKRFLGKICRIDKDIFGHIRKAIKGML